MQERLVRPAAGGLVHQDCPALGAREEVGARSPRRRVEPQLVPLPRELQRRGVGSRGPHPRDQPAEDAVANLGQDTVEGDGVQTSP